MNYSIVNNPSVKIDIITVRDYYKEINPKLAKQFLFRINEAIKYIVNSPIGFQVKYGVVRTLLLKQFPYHIHFIVDDDKQQIIILAIIHAYKNPKGYLK